LFFCAAAVGSKAQSVETKTDRTQLLIGERLEYELLINLPASGYSINFQLPDTITHFEVIENKNFDTVSSNGSYVVRKKIVFTSFDSGLWRIPSFNLSVIKGNAVSKLNTDSILVNVGYSPADSTNQLRDIKPVMDVTVTDDSWIYVAGIVLAIIVVLLLLYFYFRKRNKAAAPLFHSALSPFDEAMKSLSELKELNLSKAEQVKIFHTSLADIFKKYYSRKQGKNLMNKTTADILIITREQEANPKLIASLAQALRGSDAVKFAKYIPAEAESNNNLTLVKDAIELIENDQSSIKS